MDFPDFLNNDSFSGSGDDSPSDKKNKQKNLLNSDENNSLENDKSSEKDNSSENDNKSSEKEEKEGDKKRNEVRKQFTKEFTKIIAKFIPPKINFKGNIQKKKIIEEIKFGDKFVSNLTLFSLCQLSNALIDFSISSNDERIFPQSDTIYKKH